MQPNRQGRPTATSWVQMRSAGQAAQQAQYQQQQQHQQLPATCQQSSALLASEQGAIISTANVRCSLTSIGTSSTTSSSNSSSLVTGSSLTQTTTTATTSNGSPVLGASPLAEQLAASQLFAGTNLANAPTPLQMIEQHQQLIGSASDHLQHQQQQQQDLATTDEEQRQEENRKLRLQLYVFVLRCISYSFNAKQTNITDLHYRQQQQHLKLRKNQLEQIVQLHTRFIRLNSFASAGKCPHQQLNKYLTNLQLKQLDELYEKVHLTFNRKFLQNERMRLFVESDCCSQQDLRDIFRQHVERILKESKLFLPPKTTTSNTMIRRSLSPKGDTITTTASATTGDPHHQQQPVNALLVNRELIINHWLAEFESVIREEPDGSLSGAGPAGSCSASGQLEPLALSVTPVGGLQTSGSGAIQAAGSGSSSSFSQQQQQQALNLSKEQLYQMFQNILNIKKFEHQLLYNALQLDSSDEQAAAVRRELDGRVSRIAELERNKKLMPKFVLKEMESLYLEESRMSVNKLMVNLDNLPVMKGSSNESRGVYGLQKFRRYNNR